MEGHRGLVNSRSRLLPSLLGSRRGGGRRKKVEKEGIARDGAKRGSGSAMKIFDEPLPAGFLGYRLDATRDNRVG